MRPAWALLLVMGLWGSSPARAQQQGAAAPEVRQNAPIAPLSGFVENRGQWPDEVRFLAREGGIEAVLLADALVLHPVPRALPWTEEERLAGLPSRVAEVTGPPLTIRFSGARTLEGEGVLPTQHHFLLGGGFTRHVPGFQRVVYRELVPGIDVVVRTGTQGFAYDIQARPGADLDALVLVIEGAWDVLPVSGHVLAMETAAGRVEQRIEAAWQVGAQDGRRTSVASRFRLLEETDGHVRVGFEAPARDARSALVIDPTLAFATYVGGTGQDTLRDMDVAPDGAVHLALRSFSAPTTPGAFQPVGGGGIDAWVGKLSPDGSALEWATFLGGPNTEEVYSLDLDHDGTVVVFGNTWSPSFPVTPGSLDTTIENAPQKSELFVTRLTPDGSDLVWSTFYGGPDHEIAETAALFPSGDVLIVADPVTADPPATSGVLDTVYDDDDRFVTRISADGTVLVFQTYFRGSVKDIAFDGELNIYLAGAGDTTFVATPGAFKGVLAPGDASDAAITKMDGLATQRHWSTLLGGDEGADLALGMAVDAAGAVYVCGWTNSDDFPTTSGMARGPPSAKNGFVTKLLPGGSGMVWSTTYLSGCCVSTFLTDLVVDVAGDVFVAGDSLHSTGYPVTADAFQPDIVGGNSEAHLTKLDAFGEGLVYSTYFGGSGSDSLSRVDLDAAWDAYMAIQSTSSDIEVTPGAYSEYSGFGDTVVGKLTGIPIAPWRVLGGGIVGTVDTPNLAGAGVLTAGSETRLSVRGGAPQSAVLLTLAYPPTQGLGLLGDGLSLAPTAAVLLPFATGEDGALDIVFPWPAFPAGVRRDLQIWIADAGAPGGWSATNALRLISQ